MILFYLREAFKSVTRAKASFVLTTISLTIAVLLILASFISIQLSQLFESKLKNNVKINLFIKDTVSEKSIKKFKTELEKEAYVASVKYVDKKQAADIFIKETGEDFRDVLDYNPLPASFVISLNTEWVQQDTVKAIISSFSKFNWVDEVVFKDSFVYRILNYIDRTKQYIFIITGIIFLISLYLVYSTIRLIINARRKELETMKLVGAKLITIKAPVVLNGIIAGLLAGIIAAVIVHFVKIQFAAVHLISSFIEQNSLSYILILMLTGPVFSFIVTVYALRKVSLKI